MGICALSSERVSCSNGREEVENTVICVMDTWSSALTVLVF